MKNIKDIELTGPLAILFFIILSLFILFAYPWLSFWITYFIGWITKITIGNYIVEGFSLIGIALPLNKIPLLAGTLGWIGGFFKSISNLKSNEEN